MSAKDALSSALHHGATAAASPLARRELIRRLGGVVGFTFAFQTLFASFAVPLQTEKFYDLAGSLGFATSTVLSAYYPSFRQLVTNVRSGSGSWLTPGMFRNPITALHPRQLMMSAMTLFWAGRLGSFLVQRIAKSGSDSRFDEIKKSPLAFSGAWAGQATWICLAGLPVWLVNSLPRAAQPALGLRDLLGLGIWIGGMALEVTADRQKSAWRQAKEEKKHDEKFIKSGVWSWSRHPNYVGEVTLWAGVAAVSTGALFPAAAAGAVASWAPYTVLLSPLFEYLLLTKASGVPLLEKSAEKKWGDDPAWKEYKKKVPVFFAWPGSKI